MKLKELNLQEIEAFLDDFRSLEEYAENKGMSYGGLAKRLRNEVQDYHEILLRNSEVKKEMKVKDRFDKIGKSLDQLVEEGFSLNKLYEEYGIPVQLSTRFLKRFHPGIYELLRSNGKENKSTSNRKLSDEELQLAVEMSESGLGIDTIGKEFGVDGTTIRYNLIRIYGEEKYKKLHGVSRYKENNGWNGKAIVYNGRTYQSYAEVRIARALDEAGIKFTPHPLVRSKSGKVYYPDFYIKDLDLYIEYAGMLNVSFYRKKFAHKVNEYAINNLKFMVVVPETLGTFLEQLKGDGLICNC